MKFTGAIRAWPTWTWALLAAIAFGALASLKGVPALRHDWSWDADSTSFFPNLWSSYGGWQSFGIGLARPYPDDYLLVCANAALVALLGNTIVYVVEITAIGFACSFGAARLAERIATTPGIALAAGTFALFNPWVYNKLVAGHIFMVLAYGAAMLAISEMLQRKPSARRLTIFVVLTLQQLQFFLPLVAAVAIWVAFRRRPLLPLVVSAIVAFPVVVGIVADRRYLVTLPYTTTWQTNASITPLDALLLSGYFAKYADALPGFTNLAGWCVVLLAALGAITGLMRFPRRTSTAITLFGCIWILSSGTKGLLGSGYIWLVTHVPESGLYRELYDIVGFLAIGFVVACAYAARMPLCRRIWPLCGLLYAVAWCIAPPTGFWVGFNSIPHVDVSAPSNSRFALYPALQPLGFGRVGSGLDPDAVVRSNNVTPLNTPQLSFPESSALMAYARSGDERWLAGLSVSELIERPYLHTRYDILGPQLAIPVGHKKNVHLGTHMLNGYQPELALHALPQLASLPARPWETTVFFGDVRSVHGPGVPAWWSGVSPVDVIHPLTKAVSAADGWVDARFAVASEPLLAQGIGGAITTNRVASLAIDPQKWTLVAANGRLLNERGHVVEGSGIGYRWIPPGNAGLRCNGTCVAVGQSAHPIGATTLSQQPPIAIAFDQWSSWLAIAELQPGERALLRYNVRYDDHWIAIAAWKPLAHVAINSTFNGWIVPQRDNAQRIIIIAWVAALQFVLMSAATATMLALCAWWALEAKRSHAGAPRVVAS